MQHPQPSTFIVPTRLETITALFRPVGEGLVFLGRPPLFDVWQEFGLARNVFAQHLGNNKTLRCLVVLEDTAECSLSGTD